MQGRRWITRGLLVAALLLCGITRVPQALEFSRRKWDLEVLGLLARSVGSSLYEVRLRGRDAVLEFAPRPARYVRLQARGTGLCPAGHVGAGSKAWLFVDEIAVE